MSGIYDGFKLCETLASDKTCLDVERYTSGTYERLFHLHVPKSRISQDDHHHILKALVLNFREANPEQIIESFFNNRGKKPDICRLLKINVSRPESGVLRKYRGVDTVAWMDWVFDKRTFRTSQ